MLCGTNNLAIFQNARNETAPSAKVGARGHTLTAYKP